MLKILNREKYIQEYRKSRGKERKNAYINLKNFINLNAHTQKRNHLKDPELYRKGV